MDDFVTEAEALADIYDDGYCFEPYSQEERSDYVSAKAHAFSQRDIGKFVVVQSARRNRKVVPFLYLANRNITKRMWWTPSAFLAMIFDKKEAAEYQAKRYKYNKARVKEISKFMAQREQFEQEYDE